MPPKKAGVKDPAMDALVAQAGKLSVSNFVRRPNYGTKGRTIEIYANSYQVTAFPTAKVIQYDVQIGDGTKRALSNKVWRSQVFKNKIGPAIWKNILFDGSKLAWSHAALPFGNELNVELDLAPESGKKRPDVIRVVIRKTTSIALQAVEEWIHGRCEASDKVQEGMTFFNHLISQSLRLDPANICLKRSFFRPNCDTMELEGGLVVKKGMFLSVRGGQKMLTINVDVATTVFWPAGSLLHLMQRYLGQQGTPVAFANWLASNFNNKRNKAELRKFRRIGFFTRHTAASKPDKDQKRFSIDGFTDQDATQTFFEKKITNPDGTTKAVKTSVSDYFLQNYRIRLQFPKLPCVKTKRGGDIPIECCFVDGDNKYNYKLDDKQTASMIKFTATRPDERRRVITSQVEQAKWATDTVLQTYGMKVNSSMMRIQARVLPAPTLDFGATGREKTVPGSSTAFGSWNLQGKKFSKTSSLRSFGCLIFASQNYCPMETARKYMRELTKTYVSHGGIVENQNPLIEYAQPPNIPETIKTFWKKVGNQANMRPQLIFFIVANKAPMPYNEIKQFCETDLGCVTQGALLQHVTRCQPQYLSNVCMKLNAKIGGSTCYLSAQNNPLHGRGANLMIGADVSHAAPGSDKPSFAAMVGSLDEQSTRYGGICNTNVDPTNTATRQEMITTENMKVFFKQMVYNFKANTNKLPQRIFYFRDGVSETEYQKVLDVEVKDMRAVCRDLNAAWQPKFTVTICSKRHHHRFFPGKPSDGDKNGNCLPGTIIERDVTDPQEYDFYLNSHKAIQGTARATHYYVIHDETGIPVDDFQAICNNMCYTYIRSTTAVSLIPPVYYAHLASLRAKCHEQTESVRSHATGHAEDVTKIMPLQETIKASMWFI
ncbi:Piwi domain-containing protein [Peziza echinospora]|nr:Piwi domain-containing protein [Peziza echinospora]